MDFRFHKVSEKERAEIKRQAKDIMDKFSERISRVKSKIPEPFIEREEFERQERADISKPYHEAPTTLPETNSDFRKRMFENAPMKNKDFILTEKKKW